MKIQTTDLNLKIGYNIFKTGHKEYSDWKTIMYNELLVRFGDMMPQNEDEKEKMLNNIWTAKFLEKSDGTLVSLQYVSESIQRAHRLHRLLELELELEKKEKEEKKKRNRLLNELFAAIKKYYKSTEFKNLLDLATKFPNLKPYNAMLIEAQMPGARYVLTAEKWKKEFHRSIKHNGRPLVYLNFSPCGFMFEIRDTEHCEEYGAKMKYEDILKKLEKPYEPNGDLSQKSYDNLINNLQYNGIKLEYFRAGADYAGNITWNKHNNTIEITKYNHNFSFQHDFYWSISINEGRSHTEDFATICHELGHLFCLHLSSPSSDESGTNNSWWEERDLSHETEEFEAEIVSYIVCKRCNIATPSEKYLASYFATNERIPKDIDVDLVFQVADLILSFTEGQQYEKGLIFRNDAVFKKQVENEIQKFKQ